MTDLAEVARRSGVSVATASRVLNPANTHAVSAATRRRVLAVAAALDFHPNGIARSLQSRRSLLIALVVHDVRDPYFNECARAAAGEAGAAGYLSVICNTDRDPSTELRYVEMLRQNRAAGIMFIGGGLENPRYQRDLARHLKAVRGYGGAAVALGPRADQIPAEVPDNRGGAELATRHLIELGHQDIAFIDGPAGLITSRQRHDGYRDALAGAGIRYREELVMPGEFTVDGGAAAVRRLLDRGTPFTAVFASNDATAIGAVQSLRAAGLKIPADVSVVGFDAIPAVHWMDPPLTTISVPMAEIGRLGARRLVALLAGQTETGTPVNIHPTQLVQLGSTARPRADG